MIGIEEIIKEFSKKSGMTEEKMSEITSMMVQYINSGAKYGPTEKGFLHWYIHDKKKTLD